MTRPQRKPQENASREKRSTTTTTNRSASTISNDARQNSGVRQSDRKQPASESRSFPTRTQISRTTTVATVSNADEYRQNRGDRGNRNLPSNNASVRAEIREKTYRADPDTARSTYQDRRHKAEIAASERRERERRNALRDHDDSKRDGASGGRHAGKYDRNDHDHSDHFSKRRSNFRVVEHRHVHGRGCGHHFYENRWHDFANSHRHYDGCGHYRRSSSNLWISFSIGHTHGLGCGHFLDDGHWLSYVGSHHHHHAGCGHFYYNGFWHNSSRYHVHGPACGHYFYDGYWNDFPRSHTHSDNCGHLYDGGNWLVLDSDSHIHGPNCGHHLFSGRWHAYPRDYYTMNRKDSLYFFVDLGDFRNRNVPEWAYEEYLENDRPVDIFRASIPLAKAYAAFAKGRYYDSLIQFNSAIGRDPRNGLIYLARAQAYIAIKDYRSAFEDISRGMELFPEWADTRINLSEIYSDTEDLDRHTEELKTWVERYPRDFKAHLVLGYFYYFHQEYDEAKNELLYALSWDDKLEVAHNLMDHILEFQAEAEILTLEQDLPQNDEVEVTTE